MADIANNKKARRDYHISETFEAGIELKGTEVKSIRAAKVNVRDTFALVEKGQLMLHGCDIQPWETAGAWFQHGSRRPRRLLMHRKEIVKISIALDQKGYTLVCLRLYWKGRRVKVELGLAKGKTHSDQRQDIKARVETREAHREVARFNQKHGF